MTLIVPFDEKKDKGQKIDPILKVVIKGVKLKQKKNNDDSFIIVFGDAGVGKSNLVLNIYEEYAGDEANIDFVTLNQKEFATRTRQVLKIINYRFLANDEAYISSKRGMSSYNVDLTGWYMANRGLKIFHIWGNPSIKVMDKDLIKERVDALIYIPMNSKNIKDYRNYYYFKKDKVLDILEKEKSLDLKTVHKYRNTKAKYRGWFEENTGRLRKEYDKKKENKMEESTIDFSSKYGETEEESKGLETMNIKETYTRLGISETTFTRWERKAFDSKLFIFGEDYISNASGVRRYSISGLDKLKTFILSQKKGGVKEKLVLGEPNYLHARGVGDA